ncbi:MAG: hypothetical protein MJY41_00050 [Bacteroidales bacterium]|nr:hypothetical protein [Bacteroidales bacterium]
MTNSIEKASGYLSPESEIVEIQLSNPILDASSGDGTGDDIIVNPEMDFRW